MRCCVTFVAYAYFKIFAGVAHLKRLNTYEFEGSVSCLTVSSDDMWLFAGGAQFDIKGARMNSLPYLIFACLAQVALCIFYSIFFFFFSHL